MTPLFTRPSTIPSVSVHDAARAADGVALVDVREPAEWALGHAPTAVHVPLSRFDTNGIPDADTLHVVCRSGNRSGRAVEALRKAGYDAYNVTGGMLAWVAEELDVVRDDGRPGTIG
jgi:rhodanese-related sulfurtransferase